MNAKYFFLIVLFLCSVLTLQATSRCAAPAPRSASIDHQEQTSTTISWSNVPNARSYQIVMSELYSRTVLETVQISAQTTYTFARQTPGVVYHYEISASYCNGGTYGFATDIISGTAIVDIIIQLVTQGHGAQFNAALPSGIGFPFNFSPSAPLCYIVNGVTTAESPNVAFNFALRAGNEEPIRIGDLGPGISNFWMTGANPIEAHSGSINLFWLHATNFEDGPDLILTPHTPLDLAITLYDDCEFLDGMTELQGHDDVARPEQAIDIYPNPVQDLLQVQIPETGTVEIWDFAGRQWYSREATESVTKQEVDVEAWPTGTYMLRWYPPNKQEPVVQYFMKH